MISLTELNASTAEIFDATVAPLFENAPWVTAELSAMRPFSTLTALHATVMTRLAAADDAAKQEFLRGHPALSPTTLRQSITMESQAEQQSAGLHALSEMEKTALDAANEQYRERFGFPFILAVRGTSIDTIRAAMERRRSAHPAAELTEALREVETISWLRLLDRVAPAATGGISTHVLDTIRTVPCAGLSGELWHLSTQAPPFRSVRFTTDANGRVPAMLCLGDLVCGTYELRFQISTYLAGQGAATQDRSFFPDVLVRFAVLNPEQHFHVPVLLSNGAYTAYRGQ